MHSESAAWATDLACGSYVVPIHHGKLLALQTICTSRRWWDDQLLVVFTLVLLAGAEIQQALLVLPIFPDGLSDLIEEYAQGAFVKEAAQYAALDWRSQSWCKWFHLRFGVYVGYGWKSFHGAYSTQQGLALYKIGIVEQLAMAGLSVLIAWLLPAESIGAVAYYLVLSPLTLICIALIVSVKETMFIYDCSGITRYLRYDFGLWKGELIRDTSFNAVAFEDVVDIKIGNDDKEHGRSVSSSRCSCLADN